MIEHLISFGLGFVSCMAFGLVIAYIAYQVTGISKDDDESLKPKR